MASGIGGKWTDGGAGMGKMARATWDPLNNTGFVQFVRGYQGERGDSTWGQAADWRSGARRWSGVILPGYRSWLDFSADNNVIHASN